MQIAYFGDINPVCESLSKDEKKLLLKENKKMFVGHTWLKYFSGQLGSEQVATFIGQSWGGKRINR